MNFAIPTELQVRNWHFAQGKNIREMIKWIQDGDDDEMIKTRAAFIIFHILYHNFTHEDIRMMGFMAFYNNCFEVYRFDNPSLLRAKKR